MQSSQGCAIRFQTLSPAGNIHVENGDPSRIGTRSHTLTMAGSKSSLTEQYLRTGTEHGLILLEFLVK